MAQQDEQNKGHDDEAAAGDRIAKAVASLLDKKGGAGGDPTEVITKLLNETHDLRAKNRELRRDLDKVRAEQKDAVILTGDDKARWEQLSKLEGDPKEIAARLTKGGEAEAKLAELTERERDREAAEAAGFKPSVLSDLRRTRGLALEMRDVQVEENGKKVTRKLPHVRPASDEQAQWAPLTEYAEQHLADYLPALRADAGSSSGSSSGVKASGTTSASGNGATWPPQHGARKDPPGASAEELASKKARRPEYQIV